MTGHVFHPGHEDLHGVTVIVDGASGRTYVGRYHERIPRGIVLHDVGVFDPASAAESRDVWLARQVRFGIRVEQRHLVIPADEAGTITPLGNIQP